tara:strand:- start:601 stop:876 length:276 start_codon:yes stop_codon:yes gene_type:complete
MLDTLCILFYTGYFKWADGSYNAVPQETTRIEIKTKELRSLLYKLNNGLWFGIVDGKIFYSTLDKYRTRVCVLADQRPIIYDLTERSIILE